MIALVATPVWAEVVIPPDARIVILGEVHDNPAHHVEQARLVGLVQPSVIVWEMLSPDQIAAAEGVDRSDAGAFGAALGWEAAGWPDFTMYHPIFLAAGPARHLGAAVDRADLRRAMEEGVAEVFGPRAADFDLIPLPPEDQAAREAEQAVAHCDALPAHLLPGMVEAQRLRDARMAMLALDALRDLGGPVVVIAGTGHARSDTGIPALLRAAAPDLRIWSLGQLEADPGADAPFDAVNVTAPAPRDDPCAVFRAPAQDSGTQGG